MSLWPYVILAACLLCAFLIAWIMTHPIQTLRAFHLIKIIMVIGMVLLPTGAQDDDIQVIDDKPLVSPDGLVEIAKSPVIGLPSTSSHGWQEDDAWRSSVLAWLSWEPGNVTMNNSSINRSLIA